MDIQHQFYAELISSEIGENMQQKLKEKERCKKYDWQLTCSEKHLWQF